MNLFKTVSLENSLIILRWARVCRFLMFILPVIILFYQFKKVSLGDFFLIQGLFSVLYFALEIPTGYIGDLFSRKKVIILSFILYFIGNIIWFLFDGFFFILLGELFFAMCCSLYSGTGEAYVYDVLKKLKREKDITKELGKIESYCQYGIAIATFTGGVVYGLLGANMTILLEIIFIFFGLILTLYLPDIPDVKRVVKEGKSKWKDILEISHYAATNNEIKWLMIFPAIFGAGTLSLMWYQQPLMENNLVPVYLFGIFIGINQLFRAVFFRNSHRVFTKLKTKAYSISIFIILFLGFLAAFIMPSTSNMIITYILLLIVGFAAASQASLSIVMSSMINHRIKSDERATVLSVSSMFGRFFCAIIMISLKFLIDGLGLQTTIAIIGVITLILTFFSMGKLLKLKI